MYLKYILRLKQFFSVILGPVVYELFVTNHSLEEPLMKSSSDFWRESSIRAGAILIT
jgi:hypothetical protein